MCSRCGRRPRGRQSRERGTGLQELEVQRDNFILHLGGSFKYLNSWHSNYDCVPGELI